VDERAGSKKEPDDPKNRRALKSAILHRWKSLAEAAGLFNDTNANGRNS
jgi:hypothetical protein